MSDPHSFAMLEAGTVRVHNVIATYAKNVLDFVLGTIVACAFGYYIAYEINPLALGEPASGGSHDAEQFLFRAQRSSEPSIKY